jgi:hypothetical protein
MIVITRNGKTHVYTGWREWLLLAAWFVVSWLILVLMVFFFVGFAITAGVLMLLALPAMILVGAVSAMMRRRGS